METTGDKKEILAVFNLLNSEELAPIIESVKKRITEREKQPSATLITQSTHVGKKVMEQRVGEYSVTNFLQPRPGEGHANYYKRLRPLDDPEFVLGKVTSFFKNAGVGFHNLPWSEQLVLARVLLLEDLDKKQLAEHAKKFGLAGIRTFLSLEKDEAIGNKILEIGEKLPPEVSKEIFNKYAEIIDATEEIKGHKEKLNEAQVPQIAEDLATKAHRLLLHFYSETSKKLDAESMLLQLEAYRGEVAFYLSTLALLTKEKTTSYAREIENNLTVKQSGKFTEQEEKEMQAIFAFGRAEVFPKELAEQSNLEFKKKITEGSHTFFILKSPEGHVMAFLHTDPVKDSSGNEISNAIYVGSLNLSPEARSGPLGVVFVKQLLETRGLGKDIYADVLETNSRAFNFYKLLGFKIREDEPFELIEGGGKSFRNMNLIKKSEEGKSQALAKAA